MYAESMTYLWPYRTNEPTFDAGGRRRCENCNGFLQTEPDEEEYEDHGLDEDGYRDYLKTETRTCHGCGHDNVTR